MNLNWMEALALHDTGVKIQAMYPDATEDSWFDVDDHPHFVFEQNPHYLYRVKPEPPQTERK